MMMDETVVYYSFPSVFENTIYKQESIIMDSLYKFMKFVLLLGEIVSLYLKHHNYTDIELY